MKYHWHISGVLLGLSIGLASWTAQELSWLPERIASASAEEQKAEKAGLGLEEREKKLVEREQILQEQLRRHEAFLKEGSEKLSTDRKKMDEQLKSHELEWKKKISELEKQLKAKTEELEKTKSRRMDNMRAVYEKMDPKSAAKILQEVDYDLAVRLLSEMKDQKAAEILSKMNPEKARTITELNVGKAKKNSHAVNEVKEDNPIAPIGDQKK